MASGVNVKMGVTGVSQFKQSMNQAKLATKTLDAQLALTEKQFKASGDAESYMAEKTALLKTKLEQQKSVVENAQKALDQMAKNGVDRSSKSYQDLYRQMVTAKGEMLDTENAMNGVAEAGEEAANGVDSMNQQLKRIGDGVSYQNVLDGIDSITGGIEKVIKKAWQMGEALVKATLGAGSWADELMATAAQYEIDPETLQRMRKTANLIDTDVDTILSAKQKMTQGIGKGDKEALGAFAELLGGGWDPTVKKAEDNFWAVGEALMKLDDEYDKQIYAQKLFGKSWRELVPLFKTGREEYEKTMASWSVVDEDQLDSLGKMDDAYQKMQGEWETFKMELLSAFSDPLTEGMKTITGLFQELNEYLDTPKGKAMLQQLGDTVSGLIRDLTEIDPEQVVSGLKSVIDGITDALKWIDEHHQDVVAAMGAIFVGWGTLKLTGGAIKVLELVNGLKWLKGNPNITIPGAGSGAGGQAAQAAGKSAAGSWLGTKVTGAAAGASNFIVSSGLQTLAPVVGDMFLNQTNAGRALRDGTDVLEGVKQDLEEKAEEVKQNASTFQQDWMENILFRKTMDFFTGGFAFGDPDYDEEEDENWQAIHDDIERMGGFVDDLTGGADAQKQSSSEMSAAAGTLEGMPALVYEAIIRGMGQIQINIDGQAAGNVISPYTNSFFGNMIANLLK